MMGKNENESCFIIAEAGVNHNGDIELAMKLVDAAVSADADAVKFQTFRTENLVTKTARKVQYQSENTGGDGTQYEMLKRLELSFDDFRVLKKYCDKKGIQFLSTPFDEESANFLINELAMEIVKISSGEATNLPFLRFLAGFNRPIILSTGMCDLEEVKTSVGAIQAEGFSNTLTLLHCTTSYPCPYEDVNLKAILTLKKTFNLPVGYSDHTLGIEVPVAAVALGAQVIEKHFTLDRRMEGPDHKCSLDPQALKNMVCFIRNVELSFGDGIKKQTFEELETRKNVRRNLVLNKTLTAGSVLKQEDLIAKRAGGGIYPKDIDKLIGLRLNKNKKKDEPIYWNDVLGGG